MIIILFQIQAFDMLNLRFEAFPSSKVKMSAQKKGKSLRSTENEKEA